MENFETAFQCLILDFETLRGKVEALKSTDFFRVIACKATKRDEADHDNVAADYLEGQKDDGVEGKGDV